MQARFINNNLSGNDATQFTLNEIREMINKYKINTEIRKSFSDILRGIDGRDSLKVIEAIYKYYVKNMRYQKDINEVETLQSSLRSLVLGFGDCDDATIVLGTFYEAAGLKTRIVLVSNRADKVFNHVFIQVWDGIHWITADPVENYLGIGFNKKISNSYIEGGEKDMQLLKLEGLGKTEHPNQKRLIRVRIKTVDKNLGMMFPVLLGELNKNDNTYFRINNDPNLGWFGSKLVKSVTNSVASVAQSAYSAAKSVASNIADVAKAVASGALSVVDMATMPLKVVTKGITNQLKKIPVMGEVVKKADKIVSSVDKMANKEIKNAIKNIDDPRKALLQLSNYSGYFPPQIGVPLAFVAQFINKPTLNTNELAIMAAKSVKIPGTTLSVYEAYMLAKKLKEIVQDPKKLLTVNNALDLAKAVASQYGGVSKETMDKVNMVMDKINQAKDLYNKGMSIVNQVKDFENQANEITNNAHKEVVKAIEKNQTVIEENLNKAIETKKVVEKMNRYNDLAKGVLTEAEVMAFKEMPEAEIFEKILEKPGWEALPKLERINRVFAAGNIKPTQAQIDSYMKLTTFEPVAINDVFTYVHGSGQNIEEGINAKIVKEAQTELFKSYPDNVIIKPDNFISIKSLETAFENPLIPVSTNIDTPQSLINTIKKELEAI